MMLIEEIEEFGRYVAIIGFRDVKIRDIESFLGEIRRRAKATVQLFDAKAIAGHDHLYFAALNALKAFQDDLNISESLAMEVLLYASGQSRIEKAIDMLGIKPGTSDIVIVLIAEGREEIEGSIEAISKVIEGKRDDTVREIRSPEKIELLKRIFRISSLEMETKREMSEEEALTELIIERVALLVTKAKV